MQTLEVEQNGVDSKEITLPTEIVVVDVASKEKERNWAVSSAMHSNLCSWCGRQHAFADF